MISVRLTFLFVATSSMLFLAACESDSDKAERYFQSGLSLIEQGDKERALLELRNVFNYDGFHREARETYARTLIELERPSEAYSQYLRLVEQYPDAVEARITLAELAIVTGNWSEVERHGTSAIELAPERLDTQALDLLLQYRAARIGDDPQTAPAVAEQAKTLLAEIRATETEENSALVRLILDDMVKNAPPGDTLAFLEKAIERDPTAEDLHMVKVQLLETTGDVAGIGVQLEKMTALFPENDLIKQAMITWFLSQDDIDGAEAFLRAQAGDDTGPTDGHVAVIQLLGTRRGEDAALSEISRLEAANAGSDNAHFYGAMRAAQNYENGNTAEAIEELRALIEATGDTEQKVEMQVLLAQMLSETGAPEQVDALIATILESDISNVDALKIQGSRLIEKDQPGEAIISLRRALDQSPRDAEILTIMAQAHQRDGDIELASERLALAVEVSGNAAPEAMRYAQLLISMDRLQIAETVLEDARRRDPRNPQLLAMLGELHLRSGAWQKAQNIVKAFRALETPATDRTATELQAAVLQGQNRVEDSLNILETEISQDPSDPARVRAILLIIQTQIRSGKIEAARNYLDTELAQNPDNFDMRMLDATLYAMSGDMKAAEAGYRALIDDFPQRHQPVQLLLNALRSQGKSEEVKALLQDSLARMPENTTLLFEQAAIQEQEGDIDAAISTYEKLYAADSSNLILANNLASLISAHKDDAESLSRAAMISRRLRGTEIPAFQDTYGWISYRRDNLDEAVEYLEPAAKGLPNDALVQYHLGMTYVGLGNIEGAKTQLERALDLDEGRDLPQMQIAQQTLTELEQGPAPATD
jgi:tetratricopeptide (TPR) repeat protein